MLKIQSVLVIGKNTYGYIYKFHIVCSPNLFICYAAYLNIYGLFYFYFASYIYDFINYSALNVL